MSVRNNARRGGVQVRAPTIFFSAFESSAANDGPLAGHQKLSLQAKPATGFPYKLRVMVGTSRISRLNDKKRDSEQ